MNRSVLSWGPYGGGKTVFGCSSFVDPLTGEPVEGQTGRLLLIGRENNIDINVPEECIKRFKPARPRWMKFIEDLEDYLRAAGAVAAKDIKDGTHIGPSNFVFDGWSELQNDFLFAFEEANPNADGWARWDAWKHKFMALQTLLDPDILNANVFSTARVSEFKEPIKTKEGGTKRRDPLWMEEYDYYPAIDGWARLQLGHYFQHIVYHQVERKRRGSKWTPEWISYWTQEGPYLVRNNAFHKWEEAGLKGRMVNATWPYIAEVLGG
jgi:hypothetical protein